jgi:hypothetical protein
MSKYKGSKKVLGVFLPQNLLNCLDILACGYRMSKQSVVAELVKKIRYKNSNDKLYTESAKRLLKEFNIIKMKKLYSETWTLPKHINQHFEDWKNNVYQDLVKKHINEEVIKKVIDKLEVLWQNQ